MNSLQQEQQRKLIQGAIYSLQRLKCKQPVLKTIASWIILEDKFNNKQFSFELAVMFSQACNFLNEEENNINKLNEIQQKKLLNKIRTSMFIQYSRAIQAGKT